jgi:coenzyme F420-reducing hydrogenase alpha subunit
MMNKLLDKGIKPEKPIGNLRAMVAAGASECRGILFHDYTYNRQGSIETANVLFTPTKANMLTM